MTPLSKAGIAGFVFRKVVLSQDSSERIFEHIGALDDVNDLTLFRGPDE